MTSRGKISRLPHVQQVADAPYLLVVPLGRHEMALPSAFNDDNVAVVGSVGGMYFAQDRVTITQGRLAHPASADEMVATAEAARLSGWHLGQTIRFGAYSVQQAETAGLIHGARPPDLFHWESTPPSRCL